MIPSNLSPYRKQHIRTLTASTPPSRSSFAIKPSPCATHFNNTPYFSTAHPSASASSTTHIPLVQYYGCIQQFQQTCFSLLIPLHADTLVRPLKSESSYSSSSSCSSSSGDRGSNKIGLRLAHISSPQGTPLDQMQGNTRWCPFHLQIGTVTAAVGKIKTSVHRRNHEKEEEA